MPVMEQPQESTCITNTFLYFWCFLLNKDDSKPFFERNNFSKFIYILIATAAILAVGTVGLLIFILIGIIGNSITVSNYCVLDQSFGLAFLSCGMSGLNYVLFCALDLLLMMLMMSPCIAFLVSKQDTFEISNIWCKRFCYTLLTVVSLPIAVCLNLLLGVVFSKIFDPLNGCSLNNYQSVVNVNCLKSGIVASGIIIVIYVGILVIIGIVMLMHKCYRNCVNIWHLHKNQQNSNKEQLVEI